MELPNQEKIWMLGEKETWPPITKTIPVRLTRHTGHCWRSKDELICDVLPWTPSHGRAKAGWPARTYIQQLFEDTGCSPEDLPDAMNDREMWQKRGQGYPCWRHDKMMIINTWASWKLKPSNKWRWKKKLKMSISGEKEIYSKRKYIVGTL